MRIGFDAKRAFLNQSGLGNYSRLIIQEVSRREQAILFTPQVNSVLKLNTTVELVAPSGIWKYAKALWRSKGLVKDLNKNFVELYHGLSNELPKGIQKAGIPSVVTIHDVIFKRYPDWYKAPDRFVYDQKTKQALKEADAVVAISEQTKNDILTYYSVPQEKIHVIYQDCDAQFKVSANEERKEKIKRKYNLPDKYLLSVGTIEPRKNQLMAVKTAVELNVPIVLIGRKTPYFDELLTYVNEHQARHLLIDLDDVPFEDFPSIYQLSTCFLYVSIFEGFGIPILEALHSGVPVVTSKGSCFEETGGEAALYVEDQENCTQAVKSLLNDEVKVATMIKEGKAHAAKFDVEKTIPQLLNLYAQLIK